MPKIGAQTVPYNDLAVAKLARAKVAKQTEYTVEGVPGLCLVVRPSGVASWLVQYQVGRGAQRRRVRATLGKVGAIKLATARERARALVDAAAKGLDTVAAEKRETKALTLRELFEARVAKDAGTAARTMEDYRAVLERHVFSALGDRPAGQITAEDFALVLEGVAAASPHRGHKARSGLGSTYRWGMKQWSGGTRLVSSNPVTTIGFTHQSTPRNRVFSDAELTKLIHVLGTTTGITEPMRLVLRLLLLTGQRVTEIAGLRVAEIKGLHTANPKLQIDALRMKRRVEQHLPLSKQAVAVLVEALALAQGGEYVFEGSNTGRRDGTWLQPHIAQQSVSRAMAKVAAEAGVDDAWAHDFRRCIVTWLADNGHADEVTLDAILHHARPGVTARVYNWSVYEGPVRHALGVWADHISTLAGEPVLGEGAGNGNANVVVLRA